MKCQPLWQTRAALLLRIGYTAMGFGFDYGDTSLATAVQSVLSKIKPNDCLSPCFMELRVALV